MLPDVRLKQNAARPTTAHRCLRAPLLHRHAGGDSRFLTETIPAPYDFIATTDTEAKKAMIEQTVAGRKNIRNVIVRVREQDRGRDMATLFITCRDLFLDDRYSLVCRLHSKKSPHTASARGNLFKRHMFENLLNSEGYTTNVLDMFHDKPWVGIAVPPMVHISYGTMGHAWGQNRERADEIKKSLDLEVPFDPDTPIAAIGGMYWFRPPALRKLFAYPWKWTDYDAEPHPLDGDVGACAGAAHLLCGAGRRLHDRADHQFAPRRLELCDAGVQAAKTRSRAAKFRLQLSVPRARRVARRRVSDFATSRSPSASRSSSASLRWPSSQRAALGDQTAPARRRARRPSSFAPCVEHARPALEVTSRH